MGNPLHHGWKGKAGSVHISQDLTIWQQLLSNVNFLGLGIARCDPYFPGKCDLWLLSSYVGSFWFLEAISCYTHLQDHKCHVYVNSSTAETVAFGQSYFYRNWAIFKKIHFARRKWCIFYWGHEKWFCLKNISFVCSWFAVRWIFSTW